MFQIDRNGDLQIAGQIDPWLKLLFQDLSCDLSHCNQLLSAISAIRSGEMEIFRAGYDLTRLVVQPQGATLRFGTTFLSGREVALSLDFLEQHVSGLRSAMRDAPSDEE